MSKGSSFLTAAGLCRLNAVGVAKRRAGSTPYLLRIDAQSETDTAVPSDLALWAMMTDSTFAFQGSWHRRQAHAALRAFIEVMQPHKPNDADKENSEERENETGRTPFCP
jgi:hypothetical protein